MVLFDYVVKSAGLFFLSSNDLPIGYIVAPEETMYSWKRITCNFNFRATECPWYAVAPDSIYILARCNPNRSTTAADRPPRADQWFLMP